MAKLLGFQKPTPKKAGAGGLTDQTVRILEKTYLNRTGTGEFTNAEQIDGLLHELKKLPQNENVLEKVVDLENKKLQFKNKLTDIGNSKALLEDNLNDALRVAAKSNYQDPKSLVAEYMNVYSAYEEQIDQYISDNITKKYGTATAIPDEYIQLKNKIKDKSRYYGSLSAMFASGDVEGINPDVLAVKLETNPLTGKIISADVIPKSELSKEFMATDIKTKISDGLSVPIYINSQDAGMEGKTKLKTARLGSVNFKGSTKVLTDGSTEEKALGDTVGMGVLNAQNKPTSMWDIFKFGDAQAKEDQNENTNTAIDQWKTDGVTLDQFSFDGNDYGPGSVVRKGSNIYYQEDDGSLSMFEGNDLNERKQNAKKYLLDRQQDPAVVDRTGYVDDTYFVAPNGESRIKNRIGANYTAVQAPTSPTTNVFSSSTPQIEDPNTLSTSSSFFGNRTNRQNKPDANIKGASSTAIETGAATSTSLIDKAMGFFKNKVK